MEYKLSSPSKINLTLRITGVREDGMHNIGSLFYRLPATERLTLRCKKTDNVNKDIIRVHGQLIAGRNILERVLEAARALNRRLPAMEIDLWKEIPPGSGLGSGSGNAAALARWLSDEAGVSFSRKTISDLGSDVPFLYDGDMLSFRYGKGTEPVPGFSMQVFRHVVMVIIPWWISPTREAYRIADEIYQSSGWPVTVDEAIEEGRRVAKAIDKGEEIGLLPNDFTSVILKGHPEYSLLFRKAEKSGAFAWGVAGSGSAFFCLFKGRVHSDVAENLFASTGQAKKILFLE